MWIGLALFRSDRQLLHHGDAHKDPAANENVPSAYAEGVDWAADLNIQDSAGQTALFRAAAKVFPLSESFLLLLYGELCEGCMWNTVEV